MHPLSSILADRRPRGVVEIGRDREGSAWTANPDLIDAQIIDVADGRPSQAIDLAGELDTAGVPLDLVIDHPGDDARRAVDAIEALLPRVAPGGLFVVDDALTPDIVMQLMLATVTSPDLLQQAEVSNRSLVLTRGRSPSDSGPWRLADLYTDPYGILAGERC